MSLGSLMRKHEVHRAVTFHYATHVGFLLGCGFLPYIPRQVHLGESQCDICSPCKSTEQCTLVGVAHWIERQPANQRVASSIPRQGTGLGYGPGPQEGE